MKKIKLLSALALSLVMASCDNYELPNPPAQTNPEPEAVFTDGDINMAPATEAINLQALSESGDNATVATISELLNFPEGYDLAVDMQVGNDAQFTKFVTVPTVIVDNTTVTVLPSLFNGAIRDMLTKTPGQVNVPVRFVAYAERGTTRLRLGGMDKFFAKELLDVTSFNADIVIENAYYLVPCDAAGTPDFAKAQKMNNTRGEGWSGYDAPGFSAKVEIPLGSEFFFKIAPESAMVGSDASALFGGNMAENGVSGKLGTNYAAIESPYQGDVLISVNMEERSFEISYAFEMLYPFGTSAAAPAMLLYTTNYSTYFGVASVNKVVMLGTNAVKGQGMTFKADPNAEGGDYTTEEGEWMGIHGGLTAGEDGENIVMSISGNHLYYIEANLSYLTYSAKLINTLSIIGQNDDSEKNWNLAYAAANCSLTPNRTFTIWTATDVEIGTEFKINANGAWDVDFGGAADDDIMGQYVYHVGYKGKNLQCNPGKYDVTLNFSAYPYTLTLTPKN